jgi:hypothetical protein
VPGGLDGDAQVVRDGPGDGGGHVGGTGGADRDRRSVLDGDVPGGHLGGQPVVARGIDRTVDLAAQPVDGADRERRHQGVENLVTEDGGGQLGLLGETHEGGFPLRGRGGGRGSDGSRR